MKINLLICLFLGLLPCTLQSHWLKPEAINLTSLRNRISPVPPTVLYYATDAQFLPGIQTIGILASRDKQILLTSDFQVANQLASRFKQPLVLGVLALDLHMAGQSFFRASNTHWYVNGVIPASYVYQLPQVT